MIDIDSIRAEFPQLSQQVYGRPLVYLDNAATSLRPQSVIDKWDEVSSQYTANLHRAVHALAGRATDEFEAAREAVRAFIGAADRSQVIFTSGVTHSLNLVASSFGRAFLKEGDEVLVTEAEHHSNLIPWQIACRQAGATLKAVRVLDDGRLDLDHLRQLLGSGRVRMVCVTHISNVLGLVNPVAEIVRICHDAGAYALIDGAQGIVHEAVDVQALDCDFYAFSGHKMYAAPGTGVLYGKLELLEQMPPYMGGGEMIGTATLQDFTCAPLPYKFEAGTQNISGVPTFVPAIAFLQKIRLGGIASAEKDVISYMLCELRGIDGLTLLGDVADAKVPLFSFVVRGAHHEDLALIQDKMGVAVRSGEMCAAPLMQRFGVTGMLRASFAPYNTMAEAEYFVSSLRRAIEMLR
uniref:Cysteine desulfurase n=1 Tax=uncultured bacterium fosmid pJB92C9 TaxID=1478074 RepID=A0A0H3U8F1_9BACT|nr:hypothetical protein [uncultured bacterium fosmid pJB92C9]